MKLYCYACGKAVSTEVPADTVVRAAIACPECVKTYASSDDVIADILRTLTWMCADLDYRREQTGLESTPLSPEMQLAQKLLEELRAGRIQCRRLP